MRQTTKSTDDVQINNIVRELPAKWTRSLARDPVIVQEVDTEHMPCRSTFAAAPYCKC